MDEIGMSNGFVFIKEEKKDENETYISSSSLCIKEEKIDETEASYLSDSSVLLEEEKKNEIEASYISDSFVFIKEEKMDDTNASCGINHVKQGEALVPDDGDADNGEWKRLSNGCQTSKKQKTSDSAASSKVQWKYDLHPLMKVRARRANCEEILRQEMQNYSVSRETTKIDERAKRREEMRRTHIQLADPVKTFFEAMYGSTKTLPIHLQRKIRRGLFLLVSEAEEEAEMHSNHQVKRYHEVPQQLRHQRFAEDLFRQGPNRPENG